MEDTERRSRFARAPGACVPPLPTLVASDLEIRTIGSRFAWFCWDSRGPIAIASPTGSTRTTAHAERTPAENGHAEPHKGRVDGRGLRRNAVSAVRHDRSVSHRFPTAVGSPPRIGCERVPVRIVPEWNRAGDAGQQAQAEGHQGHGRNEGERRPARGSRGSPNRREGRGVDRFRSNGRRMIDGVAGA